MQWVSAIAIYFVIWWLSLFVVLPFGQTGQPRESAVPGASDSAPARNPMLRKVIETTVVATVIFAIFWFVTEIMGYGFDDLPIIVPTPG